MHPFVHPLIQQSVHRGKHALIGTFSLHFSKAVSDLAKKIDLEPMKEVVATPLLHDTPQELAQPLGKIKDWSKGECEPIPGKTMPQIHVVERDYKMIYDKMTALDQMSENNRLVRKGFLGLRKKNMSN